MEVEAEATTVAEISVATTTYEETTCEAMALKEKAFVEVDLTKSAMSVISGTQTLFTPCFCFRY